MDKAWDSQLKAKVHGWKNNSSMLEKKKQEYLIRLEKYKVNTHSESEFQWMMRKLDIDFDRMRMNQRRLNSKGWE